MKGNPFDDDDDNGQPIKNEPIVSVRNSDDTKSKRLPPDLVLQVLLLMGFQEKPAKSVIGLEKTLRKSVELLSYETLLKKGESIRHDGMFVWKPPISAFVGKSIRNQHYLHKLAFHFIGSWLPGPPEIQGGTSSFVSFIITITPTYSCRLVPTYKVERRFSEFYNLYCSLYDKIWEVFPSGMTNPFPDDRWSAWFSGVSEDRSNSRRVSLDAWLKEILRSPEILTDLDSFMAIRDFLEMKHLLD